MTSEQLIVLVTLVIMIAVIPAIRNRLRIKRVILDRFNIHSEAEQHKKDDPEPTFTDTEPRLMTAEQSEAELERLQKLIEDRKRFAWNTDVAYHLWGLYKSLMVYTSQSYIPGGEWYGVKILVFTTQNGTNTLLFELKGAKYRFVDDEEKQGWRELTKFFSLFLYDDADRCLIEIPMKMKVDDTGRNYSISTGGPNAFLLGDWISDFINVKLKHQRLLNQEIRAQKHRERLSEIEDLKDRFGILD